MQTDYKTTGKCDLALAKVQESAPPTAWVLPKHSPYLENINRGLHHGLYCYIVVYYPSRLIMKYFYLKIVGLLKLWIMDYWRFGRYGISLMFESVLTKLKE